MKKFNVYRVELVKEKEVEYRSVHASDEAAAIFRELIGNAAEEYMYCLGTDTRGNVVAAFEVSHGDVSGSIVHPREIFKRLVLANCSAFLVGHNHPSGSIAFSPEDISVTKRLKEAGELLGIKMLDHLVVTDDSFSSANAQGLV